MNRDFASKGYKVVSNTDATAHNFYAVQVLEEAVITTLVAPTAGSPDLIAYAGDEAGIAGPTLPAGATIFVRGSSITLASGKVILYTE